MSATINGWVEIDDPPRAIYPRAQERRWKAAIRIASLLIQNTDAFDSLFGLTSLGSFSPVAPERGLPDDCSDEVEAFRDIHPPWPSFFFRPTWVTWAELQAIDWKEATREGRTLVRRYRRERDGQLVPDTSPIFNEHYYKYFEPVAAANASSGQPLHSGWPEGQEWELGGMVYRSERMRREDVLNWDWRLLFNLMAVLAQSYGADGVRLVVWFEL